MLAQAGTLVRRGRPRRCEVGDPTIGADEQARLVQGAQLDRAILAAIVSNGAARGVLLVWGPRDLLGADDAPAVGALAAQVGAALENARLLAETERERERWRATVEGAPEFVGTCDAELRITYMNPAYRRALPVPENLSPEAQDRAASFGLFRPDGSGLLPSSQLPFERTLAERAPVRGIEILHRGHNGDERLVVWDAAPMWDADGRLLGAVAIGREVTTQRRLEREIDKRAGQLEATFDAMVDAVVMYDRDGTFLRANAAFRALIGIDHDPGYAQTPMAERMRRIAARTSDGKPLTPREWPMARLLRGETLAGGNASDFLVSTLDGRDALLSPSGAPVRDARGTIIGEVAIYRDVTERRRLERELQRRAGELESIFESITDGVMVYGPRGEIKYLNRAYRAMLALSGEESLRPLDTRGRAIFPRRPRLARRCRRRSGPRNASWRASR